MIGTMPMASEIARTRSSRSPISACSNKLPMSNQHTDITKGRTHGRRGDTEHSSNGLSSPAQLGDDLLGSQGSKRLFIFMLGSSLEEGKKRNTDPMRPSVDADFVTRHILFYQYIRALNNTRPDNEESSGDILCLEVVEQVLGC